jgi:hypothetical protein
VQKNESNIHLKGLVVFRHDLPAAATCPGEVLTKTEACQSEDGSFSAMPAQLNLLIIQPGSRQGRLYAVILISGLFQGSREFCGFFLYLRI